MPSEAFQKKTAALRALGPQKVWSMMISLFGDLAQGKGEVIEGPVLSHILTALDVKPEAARVALHRLRNDGWITSTKAGRISHHSLSAKGRNQTIAATPRIYAQPSNVNDAWQVVFIEDASAEANAAMLASGFSPIQPRLFAGSRDLPTPKDALVMAGTQVPDWLCQSLRPIVLLADYTALLAALTDLHEALPQGIDLSPLEIAILRCLIVHNWRRLVLKHPALPGALIAPHLPEHQCHISVAELLNRFPRPALRDIAASAANP